MSKTEYDIDLRQLRTVTLRLLDHLIETQGIDGVILDRTFYWNVPDDSLFDMSEDPSELNVGSLIDDWGFISGLLDQEEEPVAYQLTEIAPIIRYLGQIVGAKLASEGG